MRVPRSEYPRPDFQRGEAEGKDWINLNGLWAFTFDPDDRGQGEEWFRAGAGEFATRLLVPFPWESPAAWGEDRGRRDWNEDFLVKHAYLDPASVTKGNYREARRHTIGWYRRTGAVPTEWLERRVFLNFGAVDHEAAVFVNGQLVGEHEGGYTPFAFDITDHLGASGEAEITVRAHDPQDHSAQPAGKQIGWYQRTSGIWQSVFLEPRGLCHVAQAHLRPDVEAGLVMATVWLGGGVSVGTEVRVALLGPEGDEVAQERAAVASGAEPLQLSLHVPEPQVWDVDDPVMYSARVEVLAGSTRLDTVRVPFGVRSIRRAPLAEADCEYVWLNDRPVYLRGALDQSFTPWGVYTFRSQEEMVGDLEAAIDAGFNWLRIHIKAEDPAFLHHADRLGVLIMADMPSFANEGYGELACARWEAMTRDIIARDYNHPSIFSWCLFNESWGLGNQEYKGLPERQAWVRSMVEMARDLDDTRLVEDNSPCFYDHVETDLNTWHFYINEYDKAREHIEDVVRQTQPGSSFNFVPGATQGSQPLLNSEYGGISAGMGDMDVSWCFHHLTSQLRRHEKIGGYVHTELMDIEWERNGFLNYDRTPKHFGYDPTDLNNDDVLVFDFPPGSAVAASAEVRLPCFASLFSAEKLAGRRVAWQVDMTDCLGGAHIAVAEGELDVEAPPWRVTALGDIALTLPERPGLAQLRAWLEDEDGTLLGRTFAWFDIEGSDFDHDGAVCRFTRRDVSAEGLADVTAGDGPLFGGTGRGALVLDRPVPKGLEPDRVRGITFLAELASYRTTNEQTDDRVYPSDIRIRLGKTTIDTLTLPDCPADSRGVLSYIHGIPGKYGYLVRSTVEPHRVRRAAQELAEGRCRITVEVTGHGRDANGLALFMRQAGRFPVDPVVLFDVRDRK